jgi:hypothetical protein
MNKKDTYNFLRKLRLFFPFNMDEILLFVPPAGIRGRGTGGLCG